MPPQDALPPREPSSRGADRCHDIRAARVGGEADDGDHRGARGQDQERRAARGHQGGAAQDRGGGEGGRHQEGRRGRSDLRHPQGGRYDRSIRDRIQ